MEPFLILLCQLCLTILIEGTVIIMVYKSKEVLKSSFYANLLTNPPLNLTLMLLSGIGLSLSAVLIIRIALEMVVVFIEAFVYKYTLDYSFKKTFGMSFLLNLTSFVLGDIIGSIGYWRLHEWVFSL